MESHPVEKPKKRRKRQGDKYVIGWSEYIDLTDWGIEGLQAKVDTGARTSALHVENLRELPGDRVRFDVILNVKKLHHRVHVIADVLKWAKVRSSTGVYKKRCFVKTRMRLGPVEKEIEVSLVSREKMIFRMLLGRKALEGDFLVDVGNRKHLTSRPKKTKSTPAVDKTESALS